MFYNAFFYVSLFFVATTMSQQDFSTPVFPIDDFLMYDTLFTPKNISQFEIDKNVEFNDSVAKHRLDSLNQLTSVNFIYSKTIGQYIKFYLYQRPEQVSKLLSLSSYYFPIFEEYLDKNNLPLELKYLPIIESALNPNAKSPAGAVGLWQFMYYTAKEHGLRINTYLDERKDLYKSTQAACDYLKKAYKRFKDWDLAIASYNSGRGNITKAIRRSGGSTNYWEIRPFLPRETRNYIPSFIAAFYVLNFASSYGILPDKNFLFKTHTIDSVYLNRPVKIEHLAEILSIDLKLLEELNPVYKTKLVPHLSTEKFPIILPDYKWGLFLNNEDSIYELLQKMELEEKLEYPLFTDIKKTKYVVKRGDYLGRIARKHNCKVSDIMMWNDLKSSKIREGDRLYIYKLIQ